ncbi:MAG TPA: hypothetical protein VFC51_14560 [Chloroflexota bacterium]|nr:hypothetical protein [Chloroflexota bacterium]
MEHESEGEREHARTERAYPRDAIVIQFPRIDPGLRDLLLDFIPGRALLRALSRPSDEMILHARNARRERLLALRSLIDEMIEDTERPTPRRRAREVEIE